VRLHDEFSACKAKIYFTLLASAGSKLADMPDDKVALLLE
jgi:hypothetical protein